MRGEAEKSAKKITPYLREGEQVLVAARTDYKGGAKLLAGLGGGLVGAAIASKVISGDQPRGTAAEQVPTTPSLWVLTDQRMLFFKASSLKAGEPVAVIDNGWVASVLGVKAKIHLGKLRFVFHDGSGIELDLLSDREVARINESAARFAQA